MRFVIGTRGSKLALWQAEHVSTALKAKGAETVIKIIDTKGDKNLVPVNTPLVRCCLISKTRQQLLGGVKIIFSGQKRKTKFRDKCQTRPLWKPWFCLKASGLSTTSWQKPELGSPPVIKF